MLKSLVTILILFAVQFSALAQTSIPIPTRPTFPLQRPTQAGEICSMTPRDFFSPIPAPPSKEYLTNVVACAGTSGFIIALKADGTVRAWGDNTYGQCNVPAGLSNVVAVEAGWGFAVALKDNGSVLCWGFNIVVTNMPPNLKAVAIAADDFHALALLDNGNVAAWGTTHGFVPSDAIEIPKTWTNIVAISAGGTCSAGLTADGTVQAVGDSDYDYTLGSRPELQINGLAGVAAISISDGSAIALMTNGTLVFKGSSIDPNNRLGNFKRAYHVSNIVGVASDVLLSFALRSDGLLEAWGRNPAGEAEPTSQGIRNVISMSPHGRLFIRKQSTPLALSPPRRPTRAGNVLEWPITSSQSNPITNIVQASQGTYLRADGTVFSLTAPTGLSGILKVGPNWALRNDGSVASWGKNPDGDSFIAPLGLTDVVDVAQERSYLAALLRDGSIVSWPVLKYPPLLPLNPEPMVALAAGNYFLSAHLSALRPDGSAVSWGGYSLDELSYPIVAPANVTNIVQLTAAAGMAIALRSDGTITNWGEFERSFQNPPAGLSNVIAVSGTTILFANQTLIDWNPDLLTTSKEWLGPPDGLTNVISIGPGSAIIDSLVDSPTSQAPVEAQPSAVMFHITSVPGGWYEFSAKYNATNTASTNVITSDSFIATNTATSVQLSRLPPGVLFQVTPKPIIGNPIIVNGRLASISLPQIPMPVYTNVPKVSIYACAFSVQPAAVAVLNNGVLSGITVTNPGSGLTSCVEVQIDPPAPIASFYTTIDRLAISRLVAPGRIYQFEVSNNLVDWTSATAPATARTNRLTLDIPVTTGNSFYRLTEFR